MDQMKRFAIYYAPRGGAFADAAAAWLGWDLTRGRAVAQPDLPGLVDLPGLADLTAEPRKYGFHGTIKPPFRLAGGLFCVCVTGWRDYCGRRVMRSRPLSFSKSALWISRPM